MRGLGPALAGLSLLAAACAGPQVRPTLYEQAAGQEREGRWDDSLASLRAAAAIDPADPVPREAMARVYDERGWFSSAVEQWEQVLGMAGLAQGRSGAWLKAAAAARKRAGTALLKVYLERGAEAAQASNWSGAFAAFKRATELDGGNLAAWPGLAAASDQADNAAEAYLAYRRCFELLPQDADVARGFGRSAYALGHFDDALAAYQREAALKPADADAWNNCATVLVRLGRCGESLACFDRALSLAPGLMQALNGEASALYYLKRYEAARKLWARVLDINPDDPTATRNMRTLIDMGM